MRRGLTKFVWMEIDHHQVAYQQILQLTYIEDFLAAMKEVFVKLFAPFVLTFVQSLQAVGAADNGLATIPTRWDFTSALAGWNDVFDKLLRGFENKAAQVWCLVPFNTWRAVLLRFSKYSLKPLGSQKSRKAWDACHADTHPTFRGHRHE